MKKFFKTVLCVALSLILMLSAVSCNNNKGGENSSNDDYTRPSDVNIDDSFTATSKTLVVYFSKTNTTKGVAEKIQELTGADIFEIERKEPYPDAYTPTTEVAQEEKNNNARPELATYLPDEVMAEYDTIILGFPIWWYDLPMPVWTFLEEYDLSGKTIIPFFSHNGSSSGASSISTVKRLCPDSTVVDDYLSVRGSSVNDAESQVTEWINKLGIKTEE